MSDSDLLLGSTPGCTACADEEQRGHDGMCSECRTRRWRASAELWSRRAALQTFGEVLGWCCAMQLAWDEQYTCDECGHVGDDKDDQLSPLNGKRVCCGCWDAYWTRFEARNSFARGVAAALEAEQITQEYGWVRQSCVECWRGVPDVDLRHRGPFLACVDLDACRRFVAAREAGAEGMR